MAKTKKNTKQKTVANTKYTKLMAVLLIVLVAIVGYVVFTLIRGTQDSLADSSYSVWNTQGYDVRACLPNSNYNKVVAYVLPTSKDAKLQFNKFSVRFANKLDLTQVSGDFDANYSHVKVYGNPYAANAVMSASVVMNSGKSVVPFPTAITKIKPCPESFEVPQS